MLDSEPGREWLFRRALRRVAAVDRVVADYATSICGRPARRRELRPDRADGDLGSVTWSIDHEVVVEFTAAAGGRDRVVVYDVGLLGPLRRCLRNRRLVVDHESR